ncbi:unnamed protein product, partial [Musa hybrid cultivar]
SKPSPLSPSAANFKPGPTLIIPSSTDSTSHASENARMRWWSPGAKSCILWQRRARWKRSQLVRKDYSSFIVPATGGMVTSVNKHFLGNENGFLN